MKFGLTHKFSLQVRKQPDDESLNHLVTKLEDDCNTHFSCCVNDQQFQMNPERFVRMYSDVCSNEYYNCFVTDVKGEFSETDAQNNLLLTCRPTKRIRIFLSCCFGFLAFAELCIVLALTFGGTEDWWVLLFPFSIGAVAYLISYFGTAHFVKKIIAAIEKCL